MTYTLDFIKQQLRYDNITLHPAGDLFTVYPPGSDGDDGLTFGWSDSGDSGGLFIWRMGHTHWIDEFARELAQPFAQELGCARAFMDHRVFYAISPRATTYRRETALAWTRPAGTLSAHFWLFGETTSAFAPLNLASAQPPPPARRFINHRRFRKVDHREVARRLKTDHFTQTAITVGADGYQTRHRIIQAQPDPRLKNLPPIQIVFDDITGLLLGLRWGLWEDPVLTSDNEELNLLLALAKARRILHSRAGIVEFDGGHGNAPIISLYGRKSIAAILHRTHPLLAMGLKPLRLHRWNQPTADLSS
jgi:hypothetical protein